MRVAITGSGGRLGRALCSLDWGDATILPWRRRDADLANPSATGALVAAERPHTVVHTAASTDLVRCQQDKQYGWDQVALPAIHIANACAATGTRLVHISTDYVFSGEEPIHPIPTHMRPDPTHYYALCKVAAEAAAMAVPRHLVIRTTMKERGPWPHPSAPDDMWISHSYYDEVAPFVRDLALSARSGIVHFGARHVNVYDFAAATRPDVRRVKRAEITAISLPGDIRLEVSP